MKYSLLILLYACSSATLGSRNTPSPLRATSCHDGEARQGYLSPAAAGDAPCPVGFQTCVKGSWSGPTLFDSCDNSSRSCDGMAHGSVVTGYQSPTASAGMPCVPATKTCLNGTWSGPEVFPTCVAVP